MSPTKSLPINAATAADADRVYGLEPVLETGHDARFSQVQKFVSIACPYCGGGYDSAVDLTQGTQEYIEDCQVCCRSIELSIEVVNGVVKAVCERRIDGA